MNDLAGIGKISRARLSKVLERNPRVITSAVVSEALNVPSKEANRILSRWCRSGWVHRVKRGVYVLVPIDATNTDIILEEPFIIADSIYGPGYIGGFSAVKYWDLSEQVIETIYYFSTKQVKKRNPRHGSIKFKIKTIKEAKIFGLKTIWYGSQKVRISDPTKTIVDILDDPKQVGGMTIVYDIFNEYVESRYCDFKTLLDYSRKMNNKTIQKRLGFMIDTKYKEMPQEFCSLKDDISSGYSHFDPLVKGQSIVEKWKLKVSTSWKDEYDRKKWKKKLK